MHLLSPSLALLALQADKAAGRLGGTEGPDFTRYALVCGGLIAFVVGLGWVCRRVVGSQLAARAAQRSLQVIDVLPLGARQRLAVVRCYDRTFVLGLGDKEVALVGELDPAVAAAGSPPPGAPAQREFASILARIAPRLVRSSGRTGSAGKLGPEGIVG